MSSVYNRNVQCNSYGFPNKGVVFRILSGRNYTVAYGHDITKPGHYQIGLVLLYLVYVVANGTETTKASTFYNATVTIGTSCCLMQWQDKSAVTQYSNKNMS